MNLNQVRLARGPASQTFLPHAFTSDSHLYFHFGTPFACRTNHHPKSFLTQKHVLANLFLFLLTVPFFVPIASHRWSHFTEPQVNTLKSWTLRRRNKEPRRQVLQDCFGRVTLQLRSQEGTASSWSPASVKELADMPEKLCIPGLVQEKVLRSQIQSWKRFLFLS